ncbi:D-alanyl-D-alanine carboxypeptidase [Hyphomicrobium methylovorum]|uniref:D-alanyl-D-alanine carboxypeptidase family protein n=1 Tax=Hyphomicrobium methylovorum TaxID=84 RepID=UPI0015E6F93D|nr:D-alanyl-D-alanine carboxypeptidase family protein [Hyphomicrobium methylovorum]MBA2126491.1 D-alanyl-D-alanine carboxypeptidase [Hyphomicrobium methylovorum]
MQARAAGFATIILTWLGGMAPALANPTLLFEPSTGKVLYAEDIDDVWYPASLTKIMTAYVAFQAIKEGKLRLTDKIPCSLVATLQPPSKVGLKVGDQLTVEQALKAIIIKSANDVTIMLAEAVAGSETAFLERMNAAAQRLGMTRTHYNNTNGLPDPGQLSSARDLAKLARAIVTEFPEYAHYWSMPDMHIGKRRLGSHNALLRTFPGADGLKTGFTCDSGYNVIASATRDGRKLMAVVLGESSGNERAIRSAALLEYGFEMYDWKQLFNANNIDTMPIAADAQDVKSVRTTVAAWSCNDHPRKKAGHKKAKVAKKKGAAAAAKAPDDDAFSTKSAVAPTEKPQSSAEAKTD